MRRLILAAAFGVGAMLIPANSAVACPGDAVDVVDVGGVAYVTGDGGGVWLYLENGLEGGLQRGGSSIAEGAAGPLCGEDGVNADTLVL